MNHFHIHTKKAATSQFLKFSHYGDLVVLKKPDGCSKQQTEYIKNSIQLNTFTLL
jgi:hypothetical protein